MVLKNMNKKNVFRRNWNLFLISDAHFNFFSGLL